MVTENIFSEIKLKLKPVLCGQKIRLGRNFDGGYVMSNLLYNNSKTLLSLGINNEWSFELDYFLKKKNVAVYMIDDQSGLGLMVQNLFKSIGASIYRIGNFQVKSSLKNNYLILMKFLDFKFQSFFNIKYYKKRVGNNLADNEISMEMLLSKFRLKGNRVSTLLKVDIEGSEYDIIDDIVLNEQVFSGIVIEFHELLNKPERFLNAINKISEKFNIEHVHCNNYTEFNGFVTDAIEVSFINKNIQRTDLTNKMVQIQEQLDFPCDISKPEIFINFN